MGTLLAWPPRVSPAADTAPARRPVSPYRVFLTILWAGSFALWAWFLLDGLPYYATPLVERPRHPGYWALKPGGGRGLLFGVAGTVLMVLMLSYLVRKRWRPLRGAGPMKRWLDFHIYCGVFGPLWIVLHTSFKVGGLVAVAFWSMVAVALSGVLGRYLYVQFPRRRSGDALTLEEIEAEAEETARELRAAGADEVLLARVDELAARSGGSRRSLLGLLLGLPWAGLALHWRLRRLLAGGGLPRPARHRIAALARRRADLARRIVLWERLQRLFHWWHVIHRPFAALLYLFLAIHIGVATMTGYAFGFGGGS